MTGLGKSASHGGARPSVAQAKRANHRRHPRAKPGNDGEDCEAVLKKADAEAIKGLALQAISDLTRMLLVSKDPYTEEEFHDLRKAVGSSIGHIEMDILSKIYSQYPELDDIG
jgi:hypothetical protein